MARPELETVARAKVETAYGRQILGDERLAALARRPASAAGEPAAARLPPQGTRRRRR